VTQRGRSLGRQQQSDPMSVLDQAMDETIQELDRTGSGVEIEDVAGAAPRPERERRRRTPAAETERDESGRFLPRRQTRSMPVLDDDADDDEDFGDVFAEEDDEEEEPTPRRGVSRRRTPVRSVDTDDEEDDDEDEDLEDDEPRSGGRRSRTSADEDEDDEDDLDLEGDDEAEDDEEEEPAPRSKKSGSRRKRFPKTVKKEIDRAVEARVAKVIEERDRLRQQKAEQDAQESQAIDFVLKAIGTPQERQRLQAIVNDARQPIAKRNEAAGLLTRYQANEGYAQQYRTALLKINRDTDLQDTKAVRAKFKEYGLETDDAVFSEGNRAKILVHVAQSAIRMERKRSEREIARLQKALDTAKGIRVDRSVRNGTVRHSRNGTLASANGRRANGRVASPSMPRGALSKQRGIGAGSKIAFPSDEMLAQITRGEKTLADFNL
jgi:hypothetical protein